MDSVEGHDLDLPLMSNIKDILVYHYILDLTCDFEEKEFIGSITLFCKTHKKIEEVRNVKQGENEIGIETDNSIKNTQLETCSGTSYSKSTLPNNSKKEKFINQMDSSNLQNDLKFSKCSDLSNKTTQVCTAMHNELEHNFTKNMPVCEKSLYSEDAYISKDLNSSSARGLGKGSTEFKDEGTQKTPSIINDQVQNECKKQHSHDKCSLINKSSSSPVVMKLDGWDLEVKSVHKLCVLSSESTEPHLTASLANVNRSEVYESLKSAKTETLCFVSGRKCVKIWDQSVTEWEEFPEIIRIQYKTCPHGPSLKWTQDQDGRECVYTHGHWVNNRSLFPSQDVPVAMATWSAYIHVPYDLVVLMSGDKNPVVFPDKEGYSTYHYYTSMVMPSSTLALAVGSWHQTDIITDQQVTSFGDQGLSVLPCRLFSPHKCNEIAKTLLQNYLPRCMEGARWLLGPHPFSRLDILIVPRSFASLGMASPSLTFLSQSVISPDGAMLVRVAHELSHSWFGLLIGPRDWHEEWLSEGFCTYTEGVIHARAMQWSPEESHEHAELQDYFKYKTLAAEITNTQQELQTLRHLEETDEEGNEVTYVKNGMNPEKGFMQVHYLKGYFLLRFLEAEVGRDKFRSFLCSLVLKFHHQLITSMDVLRLFFQMFSNELSPTATEHTLARWLDEPGIPMGLQRPNLEEIFLAEEAIKVADNVKTFNMTFSKLHWQKKRKLDIENSIEIPKLNNDQILLLLELLLDEDKLHRDILIALKKLLKLDKSNPDALHRWCELVIKYRVEQCYNDISDFLMNHQAMGVYLFGELMVTRDPVQRKLAISIYDQLKLEMEDGVCAAVRTMVYGT